MEYKTCTKCGGVFEATKEFFCKHKNGKFGLRAACKTCCNKYNQEYGKSSKVIAAKKKWREDNKEKCVVTAKNYYINNREKCDAASKKYCMNNKEKRAATGRKYYINNKEKIAVAGKKYRVNNPERVAAASKKYYINNKEKNPTASKEYYEKNKEKRAASSKKYYEKNKERILTRRAEYYANNKERYAVAAKKWWEANPDKRNVYETKRRAEKLDQSPCLTQDEKHQIDLIYKKSQELGSGWQVDHLIPLSKGGLHHPDNLQIVTKDYNLQKNDKIGFRPPTDKEIFNWN